MTQPLSSWTVNEETVNLFRNENDLEYVKEGNHPQKSIISRDLVGIYGIKRAEKLIKMFRPAIQANLEKDIHSRSFLPLFLTEGYKPVSSNEMIHYQPDPMKHVALFTRPGVNSRWAVLDFSSRKVTLYPVKESNKEADVFIEGVVSKIGYETLKNYDQFVRTFRPILEYKENQITSIVMRCMSMYDHSVSITENHWAITVVSTLGGSGSRKNKRSSRPDLHLDPGHVLIACEGLKEGRRYTRYAHLTNTRDPKSRDKDRKPTEGRVEILRKIHQKTINGPTWIRLRELVEKLINSVEENQKARHYVPFSMSRDAFDSAKVVYIPAVLGVGTILNYASIYASIQATKSFLRADNFANYVHLQLEDLRLKGKLPLPLFLGLMPDHEAYYLYQNIIQYVNVANSLTKASIPHKILICTTVLMYATGLLAVVLGKPKTIDSLRNESKSSHSCVSWIRPQLKKAGIVIRVPLHAVTPHRMVKSLHDKRNVKMSKEPEKI